MPENNNELTGALHGCRVLDLTRLLPGPLATWMLHRLGAEIIKVESPKIMDYLRITPPLVDGVNPTYRMLNEGKRHIALDLKDEKARAALFQLLETTDILVEQFRPGVLSRLGMDPEELRARFPKLIIASITGYGQSGPYAKRAGHDLNYQATAGLLARTDSRPQNTIPTYQPADVAGGSYYAISSILAAMLKRGITGQGIHLDISMTEGALPLGIVNICSQIAAPDQDLTFNSTLQGGVACYNLYQCRDGRMISVAGLEPKFWVAFCEAVERPDWIPIQMDFSQSDTLIEELSALFVSEDASYWARKFENIDCCIELVALPGELHQHPQHRSRGVFEEGPLLRLPALEATGPGATDSSTDHRFGAETRPILESIGLEAKDVEDLFARQVALQAED